MPGFDGVIGCLFGADPVAVSRHASVLLSLMGAVALLVVGVGSEQPVARQLARAGALGVCYLAFPCWCSIVWHAAAAPALCVVFDVDVPGSGQASESFDSLCNSSTPTLWKLGAVALSCGLPALLLKQLQDEHDADLAGEPRHKLAGSPLASIGSPRYNPRAPSPLFDNPRAPSPLYDQPQRPNAAGEQRLSAGASAYPAAEQLRAGLVEFLVDEYVPHWWWWEAVELARKATLCGVLTVLWPGSPLQMLAGAVLATMFLVGLVLAEPHSSTAVMRLSLWCHASTIFALLFEFTLRQSQLPQARGTASPHTARDVTPPAFPVPPRRRRPSLPSFPPSPGPVPHERPYSVCVAWDACRHQCDQCDPPAFADAGSQGPCSRRPRATALWGIPPAHIRRESRCLLAFARLP